MAIFGAFSWDWVRAGIQRAEEFVEEITGGAIVTGAEWEHLSDLARQALEGDERYTRALEFVESREERLIIIAFWRE